MCAKTQHKEVLRTFTAFCFSQTRRKTLRKTIIVRKILDDSERGGNGTGIDVQLSNGNWNFFFPLWKAIVTMSMGLVSSGHIFFADGETSSKPGGIERSMETPSRRYRKRHHHHRHSEHRRQRKRKKARLKELDELRKKVAREERKWWRKRKKELEFEEMFFDQESHNPNVIPTEEPTPCTKTPATESIEKMPENRTNLSSRIDHFRYHRVNSMSKVSHRGEGHALPFVAITDPRPRDVNTKKNQPQKL